MVINLSKWHIISRSLKNFILSLNGFDALHKETYQYALFTTLPMFHMAGWLPTTRNTWCFQPPVAWWSPLSNNLKMGELWSYYVYDMVLSSWYGFDVWIWSLIMIWSSYTDIVFSSRYGFGVSTWSFNHDIVFILICFCYYDIDLMSWHVLTCLDMVMIW